MEAEKRVAVGEGSGKGASGSKTWQGQGRTERDQGPQRWLSLGSLNIIQVVP